MFCPVVCNTSVVLKSALNIWTAHANSDVSDSQLNDSDETQIVLE